MGTRYKGKPIDKLISVYQKKIAMKEGEFKTAQGQEKLDILEDIQRMKNNIIALSNFSVREDSEIAGEREAMNADYSGLY